jgi:hypothetical protein
MYMTALTLLAVLIICIVEGIPLIKAEMQQRIDYRCYNIACWFSR